MPAQLQNLPGNDATPEPNNKDAQPEFYYEYKQGNEYTYDSGKCVLPVAGPDGTPPRVIKTHAVIGRRSMSVTALKPDAPPVIPKMGYDTKEGDVFLGGGLYLPLPQINGNQNGFNYRASAQYEFIQPAAPRGYDPNSAYQMGVYPFVTPIIETMALLKPGQTFGGTGDIYATGLTTDDTINTKNPDWGWLSTTFMPSFFFNEPVLVPEPPPDPLT